MTALTGESASNATTSEPPTEASATSKSGTTKPAAVIAERDIAATGISLTQLREIRLRHMVEGVHFVRDLSKVFLTEAGVKILTERGLWCPPKPKEEPSIVDVTVKLSPANYPALRNPKLLIGTVDGKEVRIICRSNEKFLPQMVVPCRREGELYYATRHPRWRGKW